MKKVTLITTLILMATGCATQTYQLSDAKVEKPTHEERQTFFVEGIGQSQMINAAEICGGAENIIKIESEETAADVGLYIITLGIYSPRTAKVYCKES